MSFSSEIKDRLCSLSFSCTACVAAETAGMLRFGGALTGEGVRFSTESFPVASRLHNNIEEISGIDAGFVSGAKSLTLSITNKFDIENIFLSLGDNITPFECCEAAYIRGAFLGSGSISNPEKGYHMEFTTKSEEEAELLLLFLNKRGFCAKPTLRKNHYVIYIKEVEQIADILGLMGDSGDAFRLYSIQIEKEMRNNINRQLNFENANANKTAMACSKHLVAIQKLKEAKKWTSLPSTLQEIGNLREEYPEDSLATLGQKLSPPIGKSGVNHRLERILQLAENL